MSDTDEEDWAAEEAWCDEQRAKIVAYLEQQGGQFGEVGDWPAWHVQPYVSVWAVESVVAPGAVGWWAICGDLPTDYIDGRGLTEPRAAVREFADRWTTWASEIRAGKKTPVTHRATDAEEAELGRLLASRAATLKRWAEDDEVWEEFA